MHSRVQLPHLSGAPDTRWGMSESLDPSGQKERHGPRPSASPAAQSGVGMPDSLRTSLRVVGVATTEPRLGTSHYARRLNETIGIATVPSDQSIGDLLRQVSKSRPHLCHIQFEYRAFGGALRTLVVLPLLTLRLSRRCVVLVTFHGVVARDSTSGWLAPANYHIYRTMVRWTARSAKLLVVLSDRMRDELERSYGIHNVTVIPMGCDPIPHRERQPSIRYLLFFGFLRPSKGILELLQAFGEVGTEFPELRLVIAGGPAKEREKGFVSELEREIAQHPFRDRISLRKGFLDFAEKDQLARDATVIVLPYKDRFIEISAVVHDVAGSGVPIICSNTARFDELVDGVEALHVPPDAASLTAGIRRVLREHDLRARLAEGIAHFATRESWDAIARRHLQLYEGVASTDDRWESKRPR